MGQSCCCPAKGQPQRLHQEHPGFTPLSGKEMQISLTPPHGGGAIGGGNPRYCPEPSRRPFNSQQHGVDVIRSSSGQGLPVQGWMNMGHTHQMNHHQTHTRIRKESVRCSHRWTPRGNTPEPPLTRGRVVLALYTFQARSSTELHFQKGDKLEILREDDHDWWFARHLGNGQEGYVPKNHVAQSSSLDCQDWYFGAIARKEAEKLLMSRGKQRGTFLIRKSEQNSHGFSLSIKDWDQAKGEHVKHYRIKCNEEGYYITSQQVFRNINDLVESYRTQNLGLPTILCYPCPRPQPERWDLSRETKDKWEIDRNSLEMIRKLGSGSFGEVWYGMWNNSIEVAIKTLKDGSMSGGAFLKEATIMKELRHKNILILYAVCTKENPILIVTEYMKNGALLDLLRSDEGKHLKLEDMIYIASQVAAGMAYLEKKQLIHRDLAARNVLVGESLLCKVADFGLARVVEGENYIPSSCNKFPVKWTAPEALLYNTFTIKSDVWSYGILLMEIITYGMNPYPGMNNREVIERVQNSEYRMAKPANCPDELYKVMLHTWDKDPNHRPTFEYLHLFFDDYQV